MGKSKNKVVDLKPTEITKEELQNMQQAVANINKHRNDIVQLELQKHVAVQSVFQVNEQLIMMQKNLQETYGTNNIDIQTGVINYGEGGHTICDILEEEDKYSIYIRKGNAVIPWKDFNKNMAISVEYNLEY